LRRQLVRDGAMMQSATDTGGHSALVARSTRNRFVDRFHRWSEALEGSYGLVGVTNKKLGRRARSRCGHPGPWSTANSTAAPSPSETCGPRHQSARAMCATFEKRPRSLIFDEEGMHTHKPFPPVPAAAVPSFEYVYFSRPDSMIGDARVNDVRRPAARSLPARRPAEADVVVPVPDSGVPAAIGYAQGLRRSYDLGIIRNHYVGRTFIEPTQQIVS